MYMVLIRAYVGFLVSDGLFSKMMKKSCIYLLCFFCFQGLSYEASAQALQKISFEQLDSMGAHQPRKTVVLISTSWCPYCARMKNTTLASEEVVNLLKNKCYFIELDAEQKTPVSFKGHNYQYLPAGYDTGIHELAETLAAVDGKVSFPTLVILNEKYEIIFQYPGYLTSKELYTVLRKIL